MRVIITRPNGKETRAKLVAYIPAHTEVGRREVLRYYGPSAPAHVSKPSLFGRHVFLIEGTVDGYYICPDSEVGRTWWRERT